MMEPHASIARWEGDKLTLWTSNQMIAWSTGDIAKTLGIPRENVRLVSPFIGGGFGGKLFLRRRAAGGARRAQPGGRSRSRCSGPDVQQHHPPPATIQRIRIGATPDGKITAIGHESWSGDLKAAGPELATQQTRLLYAGANRMTSLKLATSICRRAMRCARPARRRA
jgi:xanthine dehydrogenase YagR molybdenum-binding subunit